MKQIIPLTCAQCKPMFSTALAHMEYGRSLVLNHRTSWQNQSYMHVAVITFNPSQAHPFQTLSLMQKICGNQFCMHLCSCQWSQPELGIAMYILWTYQWCHLQDAHTSCTSREHTYALHRSSWFVKLHVPLIGNSLQGSELYCVIFMLCYANAVQPAWKEYGKRMLKSKSEWMHWSTKLVSLWTV
jgi:hypothetical protein